MAVGRKTCKLEAVSELSLLDLDPFGFSYCQRLALNVHMVLVALATGHVTSGDSKNMGFMGKVGCLRESFTTVWSCEPQMDQPSSPVASRLLNSTEICG